MKDWTSVLNQLKEKLEEAVDSQKQEVDKEIIKHYAIKPQYQELVEEFREILLVEYPMLKKIIEYIRVNLPATLPSQKP